ncbi:MAG: aldehyde dehydrogenase family protein [Pseudobdellovibrio sp.]
MTLNNSAPQSVSADFAANLDQTYQRLQAGLISRARNYDWRLKQLQALKKLVEDNDTALSDAMWKDLRKSKFECLATEQGFVLSEINLTLKNLKNWMKSKRASTPLYNQPGRSHITREPFGLTLIIGAWNYPINLLLAPLIGAIAGGNGALLKPSELAVHTAALIAKLIPQYLDSELFAVIQGAAAETNLILDKKFDLIFFTGSSPVGKIILAKAAVHLTPTVLELGGKSPAIVWKDANLDVAARRIAWGKFLNAGQTCVAPDYVIIHPEVYKPFVEKLILSLCDFYGQNPIQSPDYCRIVNTKNFDRLNKLLFELKVIHGGKIDREQLYVEPTLVEADENSLIMQDEIFGPILPILKMDSLDAIAKFIKARTKPLALYLFTKNNSVSDFIITETSSGSVCVNDTVLQLSVSALPFGGVGSSGMGNYHGQFSFDTFTHAKSVLKKTFWFDAPFRYPPYSNLKAFWLKWFLNS